MMFRTCSFEKEVLQALKDGHWPDGCSPELRAHVEKCASCSDVALVTQAFQHARNESVQRPPEGSPGLIWWRAQLLRRNAAEQSIRKPITVAQAFAWAIMLMVFFFFVVSQFRHALRGAAHWPALASSYFAHLFPPGTKMDWNPVFLISGLGLLALVSGVVLYLVSENR